MHTWNGILEKSWKNNKSNVSIEKNINILWYQINSDKNNIYSLDSFVLHSTEWILLPSFFVRLWYMFPYITQRLTQFETGLVDMNMLMSGSLLMSSQVVNDVDDATSICT